MQNLISKNPLVKKIVDGDVESEVFEMLFSRQLPFTEEEYLESLVSLIKRDQYKESALQQLKSIPQQTKTQYAEKRLANHQVINFILVEALSNQHLDQIAKIIQNQSLPVEFLVKIAESGNSAMLEMLLENQIKLIAYPNILDAMERNPQINNFVRGKIQEIRDFYLKEEKAAIISQEDVMENIQEIIQKEKSSEEEDEISIDDIQEKVATTLQRINELSVPERIKLALTGNRTERMVLIKDTNKMVALSVLESPKITEDEILLTLRDRSISQEIIAKIANNREYSKNYTMILEMVQNPKTPLKKSLGLVKQLHLKDLKHLTFDKNVHYVVRNLAANLYKEKTTRR